MPRLRASTHFGCGAGHSLVGIHAAGDHVNGFNRLEGRSECRGSAHPHTSVAAPAIPWSASMLLVTTLTVSIASRAGANAAAPRIHTLRLLAPSTVRPVVMRDAPLTVEIG